MQQSSLLERSGASGAMPAPASPRGQVWAYRLLWVTFFIFFASTGAGKLWDRVWHATYRFDTFWSPPHFFVFVMTTATGLLVAGIAFTPALRIWFGPTVRVPVIRWDISGTLVILGGGLIALSVTIMLDNAWHSAFGLDETQWSVPHSMLGWCWLTIILGFVSARLAFRNYRPINWITMVIMAVLILEFLCPAILGPFYLMYSPHLVHALASLPVVLTEPSAQHMYRIYLHYGLTRQTCPLFIPLVSLFAGVALALLRGLDRRPRIFLMAPFLWSFVLMSRDWYTILFLHYDGARHVQDIIPIAMREPSLWAPIPLFVAALVFAGLEYTSLSLRRRYIIVGIIFGICTFFIWHNAPWMILLALPAGFTTLLGSRIGAWFCGMLEKPSFNGLIKFLLISCTQIPAICGVVDLFMRRTTM